MEDTGWNELTRSKRLMEYYWKGYELLTEAGPIVFALETPRGCPQLYGP